jgi:hypothetical protein
MKLMFLLQTVRNVPLEYRFRIYTYGPYDGQVLEDLRTAEALKVVRVNAFEWPGGSGYDVSAGECYQQFISEAAPKLNSFNADLDWALEKFGSRTASDLEIVSTIIFVDHSQRAEKKPLSKRRLREIVHSIKPHHSAEKIDREIDGLSEQSLLSTMQ